jgi:NitT/TauT family transport system permease protein
MRGLLDRPWGLALAHVVLACVLLVAWQVASGSVIPKIWVSDPLAIGRVLVAWVRDQSLWRHVGATLVTVALGLLSGGLIGIVLGLGLASFPRVLDAVQPVLTGLFCLPKIALLPIFVIVFGIDVESKVALVASVVSFLTLYSTIDGVRDVSAELISALRLMGASKWEITRKVVIPSALPWIFTGLRISVSYALTTTVVGELLSSNRGIGFLIESSAARFNSAGVFAAVLVLVAISLVLTATLGWVEKLRSY